MVQTPLDKIRSASTPTRRCGAGQAIEHPDYGDDIQQALNDPECTLRAISDWLRDEGNLDVSPDTLGKHRRGGCACRH